MLCVSNEKADEQRGKKKKRRGIEERRGEAENENRKELYAAGVRGKGMKEEGRG